MPNYGRSDCSFRGSIITVAANGSSPGEIQAAQAAACRELQARGYPTPPGIVGDDQAVLALGPFGISPLNLRGRVLEQLLSALHDGLSPAEGVARAEERMSVWTEAEWFGIQGAAIPAIRFARSASDAEAAGEATAARGVEPSYAPAAVLADAAKYPPDDEVHARPWHALARVDRARFPGESPLWARLGIGPKTVAVLRVLRARGAPPNYPSNGNVCAHA